MHTTKESRDEPVSTVAGRESPLHGYQGDRGAPPKPRSLPAALTVAVSREAGARGGTIARRAAQKLGWQAYNQELLEYVAQEGRFQQNVVANMPADHAQWVENRLQLLMREQNISQHPSVVNMTRVILALGAQGEVVLVGRGAGCLLPHEATLHVRIIAPLQDRIAFMAEWLRLTVEEATEQVRLRDERRTQFVSTHFHRQPGDVYQYDLLLNSSLLGEDLCADLIARAAKAKLALWSGSSSA